MSHVNGSGSPRTCRKCGFELAASSKASICRDQPSCRSRQLARDLGIKLYSRTPREVLIARMDIRPPDWKARGWRPAYGESVRVGAALEFFSWCYPVGLPYCVQIDADDDIMQHRGKPMRHTHQTLATFLGMTRQQVTRAVKWHEDRGLARTGEMGELILVPQPNLSWEDRARLAPEPDGDRGRDAAIPPKWRPIVRGLLAGDLPEGIRTEAISRFRGRCTRFNDQLKGIRTEINNGLDEDCTWLATLLSRPVTWKTPKRAVSVSGQEEGAPQAILKRPLQNLPDEGPGRRDAAVYLYAEVPRLQETFPDAPFSSTRFNALGKADRELVGRILDALEPDLDVRGLVAVLTARCAALDPDSHYRQHLAMLAVWAQEFADGVAAIAAMLQRAVGRDLLPKDPVPAQLLAIGEQHRVPPYWMCRWIQDVLNRKEAQRYEIDAPQFFVTLTRDLPKFIRKNASAIVSDAYLRVNRENDALAVLVPPAPERTPDPDFAADLGAAVARAAEEKKL